MKRFMLYITPEIKEGAEALKKGPFYGKPYAEVYRHLLVLGLRAANSELEQKKSENGDDAGSPAASA